MMQASSFYCYNPAETCLWAAQKANACFYLKVKDVRLRLHCSTVPGSSFLINTNGMT